jgi:arylsulfatase A-like enzyme
MTFLDKQGITDETMIVFTSDHGEYLGDHWMGEKELFHDASSRIPLIVVDPRPEADATRGQKSSALVEAIDVAPTILDYFGGAEVPHIIEGRSLRPLLHAEQSKVRDFAVSEYDYSMRDVRKRLGVEVKDAKLTMLFDGQWKYIFAEGFRPMLFDLKADPDELTDLGADPAYSDEVARLERLFFDWARRTSQRTTISDATIAARDAVLGEAKAGILIGYRNENELREVLDQAKENTRLPHKAL